MLVVLQSRSNHGAIICNYRGTNMQILVAYRGINQISKRKEVTLMLHGSIYAMILPKPPTDENRS